MRDLAKIGQMMARRGAGLLKPSSYAALTKPEWRFTGRNGLDENGTPGGFFCSYGLAVHRIGASQQACRDGLFGDGIVRLGHAGDAYGLKSGLWWDPASGKGLAFFTTAVADSETGQRSAFTAREEAVVDRVRR